MNLTTEQAKLCGKLMLIPYYPRENHADVLDEITQFVDRADGLEWLIKTTLLAMKEWKGVAELRGLYCTRFKPADGIEADCGLAGHTPGEIEAENQRALAAAEHKLLDAGRQEPNAPMGLIAPRAVKAKILTAEKNYEPPAWLKNLT